MAWFVVLLLYGAGKLRAGGSIVFWLGIGAVAVYLVHAAMAVGRGADPWQAARKALLMALFVVIPVVFDPQTFDVFNLTKYTFVVWGALAVGVLWVAEWVRQKRIPFWRNGLHWPVLLLLGWTAITTIASTDHRISLLGFYKSYDGLYSMVAFTLIFFAVAEAFRARNLRHVLSVFYFGGSLAVLYGALQFHDRLYGGGRWDWVQWGEAGFKGSSIWSTLGNPNHLGGFLAVLLPIGVMLAVVWRNWWVRVLIGAVSAGAVLEMLQTGARGAWVGTFLALVLIAVFSIPDIIRRPVVAASIAGILVVVVIVAVLILSETGSVAKQFSSIFKLGGNSSIVQRVELWKSAIDMGTDKPLLGFGPDTFRAPFAQYQTAKFVQLYGPDQVANGPHNTFFNYLATQGFPGLLAFLALLAAAAARGFGAWRRLFRQEREGKVAEQEPAREQRRLLVAVFGGLVAYIGQASANVQQIGLSFCFWALLGLLCVIARDAGVPDTLSLRRLLAASEPDEAGAAGASRPEPEPRSLGAAAKRGSSRKPGPRPGPRPSGAGGRPAGSGARPAQAGSRPAPPRARRRGPSRPQTSGAAVFALAVGGVVAVVIAWFASGPYRADHTYRTALIYQNTAQQLSQSNNAQGSQNALNTSMKEFDRSVLANPWEAVYVEGRGRLNFALAQSVLQQNQPSQAMPYLAKARSDYQRAITLQPNSSALQAGFAEVELKVADVDKNDAGARPAAIAALRRATDANPWQPRYSLSLARTLASSDVPGALTVIERSLTTLPRNADLLRIGAQLYKASGQADKANALYQRLFEVSSTDAEANAVLGHPLTPTAEAATATASSSTTPTVASGATTTTTGPPR